MDAVSFREAAPNDAAALGVLHVASWRETYDGILPRKLLEELSSEARSAMWSMVLSDPVTYAGTTVFVAEGGGMIVGFGACGRQRDEGLKSRGYKSEVGALYVLRAHQHVGIGHALMRLMAQRLLDEGQKSGTLWVLRENAVARRFYERLGGAVVGEREEEQSGATLDEVAYGWKDLSLLVR